MGIPTHIECPGLAPGFRFSCDDSTSNGRRIMPMNEKWIDPAKLPPKPETMNTSGSFRVFTDLMKKIVEKPKPASRAPADA